MLVEKKWKKLDLGSVVRKKLVFIVDSEETL